MTFQPFTQTDFASDLFWPQLQDKFAELWTLGAIPGDPPVLPRYDRSEGYRLRKVNAAFAAIWAELSALENTAVPHIEAAYHSPAIALLVFNQALELAYTGVEAPRRTVTISGSPPPLVAGQPYDWTYSATASDDSEVETALDPDGAAWLTARGVAHDPVAHRFTSEEVLP